ncbi:MAG: hypothetical protein IJ524_00270 [Bacteroidales bacterium]|nr:hypothetical protein [Bacteroidales bacterium]
MKRVVLTMLLVMLVWSAESQPALMKGQESKRLSSEELLAARYIGEQNRLDAWIMEGRRHVKQVVLTDANLEPVSVSPIEGSGKWEVLSATPTAYRTGVLLAERGTKRTVVLRCEVDADSRAVVERPDTVAVFDYGRKDECLVWGATSPSGRYSALVVVVRMAQDQRYTTYTALFDSRMQRVWEREYGLGSLHEVVVTDDGRVVTLGVESGERRVESGEEEVHFIYNVLDSVHATTYDAVVKCAPVGEMHLVNVVGPYAVAAGTYRPTTGRNAGELTAGVLTLTFRLDAGELTGITMRPLQNEDVNVLLNEKTKKLQKQQTLDHVATVGSVATGYGAVLALSREVEVERTSDGGAAVREGYGTGLSLVAVDTTGRVRWVRNVRRNDVRRDGGLPTLGLAAGGERVCVVKSEHGKTPAIYDISAEARELKEGEKGQVVLYAVSAEGEVEKLVLEAKSKLTVLRAVTRKDGTLVYVGEQGKRTRLASLSFNF